MKVFVTGGTGFIGGHLLKRLENDGASIRALVRDANKAADLGKRGIETVIGDFTDSDSLRGKLKGCDVLYHLGNICAWWIPDKSMYYKVNVEGTKKLMLLAQEEGIQKMIFTSSMAAIRQPGGQLTTEDMEHKRDFESHYGRSKFLAEKELLRLHKENGLPVVILNPGVVMGPGDLKTFGRTVLELLNCELKAIAFEDSVAPLVYIDDVIEAHIIAAEKGKAGEKYIIVGDNVRLKEMFKLVSDMTGAALPQKRVPSLVAKLIAHALEINSFFTGKPPKFSVDGVKAMEIGAAGSNKKGREELGMSFIPLEEALTKTIDWYRENGYVHAA